MENGITTESYQALIRECSELIRQYGLHRVDGPVNLQTIIDDLDIEVTFEPLENGWHGYAITDPENNLPPAIVINSLDKPEIKDETLAHEIIHLVIHAPEREHHWWDGVANTIQEAQAFVGAAILKVPLGYLLEMARDGLSSEVIAGELGVRKELVELRWRMAVEFDELKNIFDEVEVSKVSPGELPAPVYEVGDFNQDGGEVVILGRAILRESTKVPINEVKSYQPVEVIKGVFEDGTTYTIGDPEGLAFWLSLDDDYDSDVD